MSNARSPRDVCSTTIGTKGLIARDSIEARGPIESWRRVPVGVPREHLRREERNRLTPREPAARLHAEYPGHPHQHPLQQLPSDAIARPREASLFDARCGLAEPAVPPTAVARRDGCPLPDRRT